MILALALACAPADSTSYESYDPTEAAPSGSAASPEAPVEAMREYSTLWLTQPAAWTAPKGSQTVVAFSALTTGRWLYPGSEPGEAAGEAACRAIGATHVCSEEELVRADAAGETMTVPPGTTVWVALPDKARSDSHGSSTCGKYSYEGADAKWNGISAVYSADEARARLEVKHAPASFYDPDCLRNLSACTPVVPSGFECNDTRSIACCH